MRESAQVPGLQPEERQEVRPGELRAREQPEPSGVRRAQGQLGAFLVRRAQELLELPGPSEVQQARELLGQLLEVVHNLVGVPREPSVQELRAGELRTRAGVQPEGHTRPVLRQARRTPVEAPRSVGPQPDLAPPASDRTQEPAWASGQVLAPRRRTDPPRPLP